MGSILIYFQCLNNGEASTAMAVNSNRTIALKSKHRLDAANCLKFDLFGTSRIVDPSIQPIVYKLLNEFTNDKHWGDQLIDALADGYSTAIEIHRLLQSDYEGYKLRDIALVIHWLLRGVSTCENEGTFEFRMRPLKRHDRQSSKMIIIE